MTTYHIIGGGQRIRQLQNCGRKTIIIQKKETNYVEESNVHGVDCFAGEMWNTDLETLKRNAEEWAYHPKNLIFKVVKAEATTV